MTVNRETDFPDDNDFFTLENNEKEAFLERNKVKKMIRLISAVIVGGFLLLALGLTLSAAKKNVNWRKNELSTVKLPIKGDNLILSQVKSHWEYSPVPATAENLGDLKYMPVVTVTINKKSTSGKIRCFFVDGFGKYVGDPFTANFSDGLFNGEKKLTFTSTAGFNNRSDYSAFFSGYSEPWYIEIFEGTENSNTLAQFKKLARIPIQYNSKEATP